MFRSKSLKPPKDENRGCLYQWWHESIICDYWYDFSYKFFGKPYRQIKKLVGWQINVFANDYDFDGHCLFAIIEYKLKRVQKALESGHAYQDPKDMKALRIAIKLAGRLKDDNYDMVAWDRHEKKWGELETWTVPCLNKEDMFEWHSRYPNAVFEEQKKQCRQERQVMLLAADAKMRREQKWFYGILDKYLRVWWD